MGGNAGVAAAFQRGWDSEGEAIKAKRDRKQALEDENRQYKVKDLWDQRNAIRENIHGLDEKDPAYQKGVLAINDIQTQLDDIHDPVKNPGALHRDWEFIKGLITRKKPPETPQARSSTTTSPDYFTLPAGTTSVAASAVPDTQRKVFDPQASGPTHAHLPTVTDPGLPGSSIDIPTGPIKLPGGTSAKVATPALPTSEAMAIPTPKIKGLVAPGNIPIWNRPAVKNADGSHSSEFSTSFIDENKNSPYFGKEVLVPTVVAGKFLTPDGTKPPEGSQAEHDMMEKARAHYEQTGQHLGVFDSPQSADKYSQQLHSRGDRPRPDAAAYQTPAQRRAERVGKETEQFMQAAPSTAQKTLADARAEVAAQKAKVDAYMEDWKKDHPGATPEEEAKYRQHVFENVAGFKTSLGGRYIYKNAKVNGVSRMVRYNDRDSSSMEFADGTPMTEEQAASVVFDTGKIPPGMTYDKVTNQVWDKATNIRYSKSDPNLPPEVQAMFRGHDEADAISKAYGIQLADERGKSFSFNRPMSVLDTKTNTYTFANFGQMQKEPGRYQPSGPAAKALAQVNMMEDIARTSRATRDAIGNLTEDFPKDMKVKIAVAMKSDNPDSALDELLSSAALGSLSSDQFAFLVATRQLAENAMAMRSILGAGQGSEDVRRAIQSTLPGLLSPDRQKAIMQLDQFDKTLEQLHRGIPGAKLGPANWTVQGGDQGGDQGGAPPASGTGQKARSLAAAMKVHPGWTEEQTIEDLKKHGYGYWRP